MYKWYQVLVQDLDENVDENLKDLDENLAWLTQKTEDPKGIKGTLLPPPHTHTVNVIELNYKVIKKWQPLHFYINPPPPLPFSGLLPLSSKAFCTPASDSIIGVSDYDSLISEYPWNEENNTFTWLSSLYNPFKCRNLQWDLPTTWKLRILQTHIEDFS